jgi:chromosomal replication initiator protein
MSVKYVTSGRRQRLHQLLRDKRIEGFKQRYRNYDLLLIDDVQFFEGKERFQRSSSIPSTRSTRPASQIVFPPTGRRRRSRRRGRLRSRFEWGLITDIQPPDLETRIAILRKKVKTDSIHIPDPQLLTFIAYRISTNIRELEGAHARRRVLVAHRPADDRGARPGRAQGRLPQGEWPL